jgi:hypothetical protein
MTSKLQTPAQRSAQLHKELKREFDRCGKKKTSTKKKSDKPNTGVITRAKFIELNKKWIEMEEAEKSGKVGKSGKADKPL